MAEEEKKREPLSLNQLHNRLLEDLSSSVSHSKTSSTIPNPKPKPPSSSFPVPPPPESKVKKLEGRRRLCKASSSSRDRDDEDDDVPQFFGIEDFDSPSPSPPVQMNSSRVEVGGDDDDRENRRTYGGLIFPHSQSSVSENPFKVNTNIGDDDVENRAASLDNNSTSSRITTDFTSQTEEGEGKNKNKHEEQSFSSIADFDSSLPVKKPSKLETEGKLLSCGIGDDEENKPLKVKIQGRKRLCKAGEDKNKTINDDMNFSVIADFDSPPPTENVVRSNNVGGNEIRDILNDLSSRMEILSIEKRRIPKMTEDSSFLVVDEGFLVVDEGKNRSKKEALSKYTALEYKADSLSDATNDMVNQCEDENDMQKKFEGDESVCRVNRTKSFGGQNKNECTKVGGKSNKSNYVGKEHSDDDCVVMSGHNVFKDVERRQSKLRQGHDDSDEVEILDDYGNDSVAAEETSFVLTDPKSTYKLPSKIAKMLYPHQRDGLKWLWSLHCQGKGGILGDDMGLGKTMQICGFLAGLFHSCLTKRALIVAPKTLLPHWIKELSIVGLSQKTKEYFGTCAKAREYELQYVLQHNGILLTTYDIVRNNAKSLCGNHYFHDGRTEDDFTWDYMILDEGHLIKNPSTQRAKSLLEISSAHRIIISGTPIQNNLKELWALFNFCCPELLGDKNWFKEKYEHAILRGNDKSASDRDKRIGSAVAKELRARIQPYFLRRLKDEVFREDDATSSVKLSKKNEIIVWLRLTSCQRQLYEAFLKSELVLSAFDGSPLAALTILKKICDHPLLLTKRAAEDVLEGMDSMLNQEDHRVAEKLAMHIADVTDRIDFVEKSDVSCKISFIISLLDNLIPQGHNVLIFSQTRKMLNLIQECLASKGYEFLRIDGTTKANDRVTIVNNFQEGKGAPIFLLTSQVGGLGLTLTKADRVIVVDPAWNPSTDNQSVDRAYRIGQQKDVIVYRLMTCGTVEEKIYRKQIYKGGLFKSATEHKEQIRYFSQQDLRELFSIPKQGFDVSLTQQQLHEEHDRQHKMDDYLKAHVKFLENLGIAGVSNHSLLFSKTAPVPTVPEEELIRVKQTAVMGASSSRYSVERNIDGAEFAFNPKDVQLNKKKSYSPNIGSQPTETEVKERIDRLTQMLRNQVIVSSLPDKGEKIKKQIGELNLELDRIQMEKRSEKKTIDLDDYAGDDILGKLQRVLNV